MAARTRRAAKCKQCRKRPKTVRGLCMACYMVVRRSIEANETTEKQAIEDGLIDPARPKQPRSKLRKKIVSLKSKR